MCGIVGEVVTHKERTLVALRVRNLAMAINYRGPESGGIVSSDGVSQRLQKGYGDIAEAVPLVWAERVKGLAAIAQNRYSVTGTGACQKERSTKKSINPLMDFGDDENPPKGLANCQPFFLDYRNKDELQIRISLVQNGNLTNLPEIKKFLGEKGVTKFLTETDTELILKLIVYFLENPPRKPKRGENSIVTAIRATMKKIRGAYSCLLLTSQGIFAFRDPHGFRPLKMAKTNDSFIFASEVVAWHDRAAQFLGNVNPGQIVEARIGANNLRNHKGIKAKKRAFCIFEDIYLQAGYNENVTLFRVPCGKRLFQLHPKPGITIPILDSGEMAALGYHAAQVRACPAKGFYFPALYKNPHVGRTFLEPDAEDRIRKNKAKYFRLFKAIEDEIRYLLEEVGEAWLIFIDDSLVRSNVSRTLIEIVRECLKKLYPDIYDKIKIAWLLASPPYTHPCFYGVDTYDQNDLLAYQLGCNFAKIRKSIDADYLGYLPIIDAKKIAARIHGLKPNHFCDACFTGKYPVEIDRTQTKMCLAQ